MLGPGPLVRAIDWYKWVAFSIIWLPSGLLIEQVLLLLHCAVNDLNICISAFVTGKTTRLKSHGNTSVQKTESAIWPSLDRLCTASVKLALNLCARRYIRNTLFVRSHAATLRAQIVASSHQLPHGRVTALTKYCSLTSRPIPRLASLCGKDGLQASQETQEIFVFKSVQVEPLVGNRTRVTAPTPRKTRHKYV